MEGTKYAYHNPLLGLKLNQSSCEKQVLLSSRIFTNKLDLIQGIFNRLLDGMLIYYKYMQYVYQEYLPNIFYLHIDLTYIIGE